MQNNILRRLRHLLLICMTTLSMVGVLGGLTAGNAHAAGAPSNGTVNDFRLIDSERTDPPHVKNVTGVFLYWSPTRHQVQAIARHFSGGSVTLGIYESGFLGFHFLLARQRSADTDFLVGPTAAQDKVVQACAVYSNGADDGRVQVCTGYYKNGTRV